MLIRKPSNLGINKLTTVSIVPEVGASGWEHAKRVEISSNERAVLARSTSLHTRLLVGVMLSLATFRSKPTEKPHLLKL